MSKIIILISLLSSALFAQTYNREECDQLIDVKKYIVAGSLDNISAGGKTYNFDRIVGSIENELLSGQTPDPKRFECLNNLHKKAHEDATEYWLGRLARSTCANDDGEIPNVKPTDCDSDTWEKFHSSKALIDRSAARVNKVTNECVERNGVKSCESMASLKKFQEAAGQIAESSQDTCCDINQGPAFRVLRGFYTVEFGDLPDADLQKECYKRTRPGNTVGGLGNGISTCVKSAARGIAEAVMKWFKTAKALWELGSISEIWRIVRNMSLSDVLDKISNLLLAMAEQFTAQLKSFNQCFTGQYKVDQACKLISSVAVDFLVGGGIAKGVQFLAKVLVAGVKDMGIIAKELLLSNPKVAQMSSKLKPKGAGGAATSTTAATRAASKLKAANLAAAVKPVTDFSKSLASRIKNFRKKENIRLNSSNGIEPTFTPPGPNAAATVAVSEAATPAAAAQVTSRVATGASSTGSRTLVKLTDKAVAKIEKDIRRFRDSDYKAMYATRGTRAVDAPESLFVNPKRLSGKTSAQKMQMIEDGAQAMRNRVERLSNTTHKSRLTSAQRQEMLNNIDDAVARLRTRYGVPTEVASAGGVGARIAGGSGATAQADLGAVAAKGIDTTIPGSPPPAAGSTGSTGVIGNSSTSATSSFTNTSVSFADNLPNPNLNNLPFSPTMKLSSSLQKQLDEIKVFEQQARANAATANPAASARSSIYNNMSNRAISKDALRRHAEIENLYKKGVITDEQAYALHDIVRVTENSATGTATRFNTQYISTPNTNPSTFVLAERNPPRTALGTIKSLGTASIGSDIGTVMTNKITVDNMDAGKDRYEVDTVRQSLAVVQKLADKPAAVRAEFSNLKTETEVLEHADQLRLKVKTIENTLGTNPDYDMKEQLDELLATINAERDRALTRVKTTTNPASPPEPAKAPASTLPEADPAVDLPL